MPPGRSAKPESQPNRGLDNPMMSSRRSGYILLLVVALAAGGLGFYLSPSQRTDVPSLVDPDALRPLDGEVLGRHRPEFALPDARGAKVHIARWEGQIMVINFWATWCTTCRDEIPILMRVQASLGERGLQVLGIALDEPERAEAFRDELGVNYPSLYGQQDAIDIGKALGNTAGVLPYTVVLDRSGAIRDTHFGIVDERALRALLATLL